MSAFNIFKKYLDKITQRKENKRWGRKVDIERKHVWKREIKYKNCDK